MSMTLEHDEIRDLLAVYAVDAIVDQSERDAVERHLETCAECRLEVEEHLEALAVLLPEGDAEIAHAVWSGLRERIAASAPTPERVAIIGTVVPLRVKTGRLLVGVAAIAAASVLVTLAVTRDGGRGSPAQSAEVVPAEQQAARVTGRVQLYHPDTASGTLVIDLQSVPVAPAGHHYEVWVLRPGDQLEMEPVGAFAPQDGHAELELPLPGPGPYVAVDISIQQDGASPVHSGKSLAGATLA
jgi:anti-sigma factor RsiW